MLSAFFQSAGSRREGRQQGRENDALLSQGPHATYMEDPANGASIQEDAIDEDAEQAEDEGAEESGEDGADTPLLPIFSAAHLGSVRIPTHASGLIEIVQMLCLSTMLPMPFGCS